MQYSDYKRAVNVFQTVQAYNLKVQTQRKNGNTSVSYYVFSSNAEETAFNIGNMLLIQNDPKNAALYVPVQKI
jgi:hypothetical protein